MTTWAPPVEKVTALITRPGAGGPELIVFDHGAAGVQLPAGTVEAGEDCGRAAHREAWEETGALGLELVREVASLERPFVGPVGALTHAVTVEGREVPRGSRLRLGRVDGDRLHGELWDGSALTVPTGIVARAEVRHVFWLRSTIAMPDEWRVATPDGGGVVWWCFWAGIDDAHAMLHERQRDWLDAGRAGLDESAASERAPRARPPLPDGLAGGDSWEEFWAYPFANCRYLLSFADGVDPAVCTRARALCVTRDGAVVLVAASPPKWDIPGGGREPGESIQENLAREVWEEACCRVVETVCITTLRGAELGADGGVGGEIDHHALFWARVEVEPWAPRFETRERRFATPSEAVELTTFPETTRLLLDRAAAIDPALDWEPS
ncbi:MAG TPA: NUDIX hydrolase [Acidimicrobiia bacterium]|nr:NUDIX hydrolase [Acidimicrobiia bacterium]